MIADPTTLTLGGVFVAGLATSLHCAGMCGLLTCGLGIAGHSSQMAAIGVYHATRLIGYLFAGLVLGGAGAALGLENFFPGIQWLPWLLIILLVTIAFGLDRWLGKVPGLSRAVYLLRSRTLQVPPLTRAAVIGLSTPLLPCGPLYAIYLIALVSGDAIAGAKVMLVFGLGSIPAIWITQIATAWMHRRLSAKHLQRSRQVLAALAAVSLLWHFTPGIASASESNRPGCRCAPDFSQD